MPTDQLPPRAQASVLRARQEAEYYARQRYEEELRRAAAGAAAAAEIDRHNELLEGLRAIATGKPTEIKTEDSPEE